MSDPVPTPAPAPAPQKKSSRGWLIFTTLLALIGLAGVGFGLWTFLSRSDRVKPDAVAAARANARGIGHMDQFQYDKAITEFEEAVKFAPDWSPAKINLGIALLNTQAPDKLERAMKLFREVLDVEPNNPHANFCTGIILYHRAKFPEAGKYFKTVTEIDPTDAHAWYWRGKCVPDESESAEAKDYYEKALALNPYLNAARYALAQHKLLLDDEKRKKQLLDDFLALKGRGPEDLGDIKYTEMGRYGEVIGKSPAPPADLGLMPIFERLPRISAKLGTTPWAAANKLNDLQKAVRTRFGGTILLLDFDRDGRTDVLVLGGVLRGAVVGDLLLHNEAEKGLRDVTGDFGLSKHPGSFGGAVGDFDNDGFPDIALAGPAGLKLFRNNGGKSFEDKTTAAGFDKEPGVYLTATWMDLDQDGDLDLIAAKYAQSPELAAKQLKGEKVEETGRVVVFANAGISPPSPQGTPLLPLTCAFQLMTKPDALLVKGPVVGFVMTDADGDLDIDLLVLVDGQAPVTILNDRLLRFERGEGISSGLANWAGGLVLDANGDDQSDLVLVEPGTAPRILVSKHDTPGKKLSERFAPGLTDAPSMRSAAWTDLDLDGRTDIVGLSADRKPVFLQGHGTGKFTKANAPFGPAVDSIADLIAIVVFDIDGDHVPDVLVWSDSDGLSAFRSLGNGNSSLALTLTGTRERVMTEENKYMRTNSDGVGCWVRVHAGPLRTAAETTTLCAGLGQSRLPILFGLGKAEGADVVRVRWPDAVTQAELDKTAGAATVVELNRKPSSCPILFTWDGERFVYITDFLGAGAVGESGPDGSVRPPRPEESVKIEPGRLAPLNGKFVLKIGEPMDEVMYLDRLRLDVIDHPIGTSVFPDERFATSGPQPTQDRLYFRDSERLFAAKATDHKGRDLTATLRERDGKHADGFAIRSWLGFAEDHFVELDFNGQFQALPPGRKTYLVLAGWTDYAFPESIYAATQAGVPPLWPVLEQKQPDGAWKTLGEIGIPAGLTRVMTKDITGWINPTGGPVRIRTNLQIYWDQVFVAPTTDIESSVRELPVSRASLEYRGFAQEYRPNGKLPIAYDYARLEPVCVTKWRGKLTRTGEVTELLTATDDRHVIGGPGDEVTAEFDASALPPIPANWERSMVLHSWGYCKDAAPTTLTGGNVGPLPYRAMPKFPYDPTKNPRPAHLADYDRIWNTRPAGKR